MVPHWKMSKMLSADLDKMGFSQKGVQERKLLYEKNSVIRYTNFGDRALEHRALEQILAGSLREGVGFLYYNDVDILNVDHTIICETNITEEHVEGKTVLQIDENNASPGYCFLKIVSISKTSNNALYIKQQEKWMENLPLSNMDFRIRRVTKIPVTSEFNFCPPEGPSAPVEFSILRNYFGLFDSIWSFLNFKTDVVTAFPCKVDHILHEWRDRKRSYWPEPKTLSEIMTLPTYVVPVGENDKLFEWRISFVMAEIHLIHSFNDTQTKVYVLMKIITKHALKPLCKDISSYVVKNVMFWLCEKVPRRLFKQKLLMYRLRDALKILKIAVEKRELPNYMIPKRNLFEGKLNCNEQNKITYMLDKLVKYTSNRYYKENTTLEVINQEAKALYFVTVSDNPRVKFCIPFQLLFFFKNILELHYYDRLLIKEVHEACQDLETLSTYKIGHINMLSPCPYLLVFFLAIPMRLLLMIVLPQIELFISNNKYLAWALFGSYMVLFCLIQFLKLRYWKPVILNPYFKIMLNYTSKNVQRLEEIILFLFILSFATLLGFSDITVGIHLPFMYLCFGLVLMSYQIRKFGYQFEVIVPGIKRFFKMRVIFLLLLVVAIYVTW